MEMHWDRLLTIVASSVTRGRCRYCRQPIVWATTASEPGKPARSLPFTAPRPFPLSVTRNDDTGVAFEHWPKAALHFKSCAYRPPRKRTAKRSGAGA